MEHLPNTNTHESLSPEVIRMNERVEDATNKAQFALIFDILRTEDETKELFSRVSDVEQLMLPDEEHPELQEHAVDVLARISEPFRRMVTEHPEVIDHIVQQIGGNLDFPLHDIDLTEVKEYLSKYLVALH